MTGWLTIYSHWTFSLIFLLLSDHTHAQHNVALSRALFDDDDSPWTFTPWDHSHDINITAEVDVFWPREGDTFSLGDKGMAMIFAVQNFPEAVKHGWDLSWTMCTNLTNRPGFRNCVLREPGPDRPMVLKDPSANVSNGANEEDVYIALNRDYLPVSDNRTRFDYTIGGVYDFDWQFSIGATCAFTNTSRSYAIGTVTGAGSFTVTLDPKANLPALQPTTCASYLAAVEYAGSTTTNFPSSVANSPECVVTNPITASPAPCRATLDSTQISSIVQAMAWNKDKSSAAVNTTAAGLAHGLELPSYLFVLLALFIYIL